MESTDTKKKPILSARLISKRFGGLQALDRVELDVHGGEVHALVGANGAGKSTLIKIITGAIAMDADGGEITVGDDRVDIRNPAHARQLGISAVYQEFSLINSLTVAENIFLGRPPATLGGAKVDWAAMDAEAKRVLAQLDTPIDTRALVRDLSVAQRQVVEIAKALANNSRILIMDEPTASLTDNDIEQMFKVVRTLKAKGIGIVYVSHRLEELPAIADKGWGGNCSPRWSGSIRKRHVSNYLPPPAATTTSACTNRSATASRGSTRTTRRTVSGWSK